MNLASFPLAAPRWLVVFLLSAGLAMPSSAQTDCETQAQTELEHFFCRVKKTSQGKTLPGFNDFRRNSPAVQASILKGPARQLGWPLPTASAANNNDKPVAQTRSSEPADAKPKAKPIEKPNPQVAAAVVPLTAKRPVSIPTPPPPQTRAAPLADCRLLATEVQCATRRYVLQNNRPNTQLAPGALTAANPMAMPAFRGNLQDDAAVKRYLGDSYQHYIEKMLSIGLGASTMSYTKFNYTFWELIEKREDFAGRFETMYDYLKKDKASMAIKARYSDKLPASINQCSELNSAIIVCDNGATNWVYLAN